jgi:hypothetical protein
MPDIILRKILVTEQANQFPIDEAHHCACHEAAYMGYAAESMRRSCGKHTKVSHPESCVFCHVCGTRNTSNSIHDRKTFTLTFVYK